MDGVVVKMVGSKLVIEADDSGSIVGGPERLWSCSPRPGPSPMGTRHFLLGRLMATPGALNAFVATGENPINYIVRHMNLDPSSLGTEDQLANLRAVREGTRVFSAYRLSDDTRIWIITEADRSVTTILLPEEY